MAVDAQPLVTVTSALAPAAPSPSAAEPQNALKEEVEQGGVAEPKEEPEKTKRKKAAPDSRAYQLWFLAWACLMHQNHGWSWRSSWVKPRNSAEPAAPYPANRRTTHEGGSDVKVPGHEVCLRNCVKQGLGRRSESAKK